MGGLALDIGLRLTGLAPGAGGGGADVLAPIIADAIAVWDPSTGYESATRKVIKNSVATVTDTDPNIGYPGRRCLAKQMFGPHSWLAITDNNAVAPDGSMEATTLTNGSVQDWFFQYPITLPAGTYTVAVSVKDLGASSPDFRLDGTTKTATGSWGRFSKTFSHGGGTTYIQLRAPVGNSQANFAVCDFEIFAGSSDLNTNALTQKPLFAQTQDLMLGKGSLDTAISVSGGVVANTISEVLFPDTAAFSEFTILYVAKRTAAPTTSNSITAASVFGALDFGCGPAGYPLGTYGAAGFYTAGRYASGVYSGAGVLAGGDLWVPLNGDYIVGAHRCSAAEASSWLYGHKVLKEGSIASVVHNGGMMIMSALTPSSWQKSGLSWTWGALWDRALTDQEIQDASAELMARATLQQKLIAYVGTSITGGGANNNIGNSLTVKRTGVNFGVSGETLSGAVSKAASLDALITSGPAVSDSLLVLEFGVNDLNVATPNATAFTNAYADYIDARLAAGWTNVIATTILPRTDAGGASDVDFDAARATANTTIRSWVGGRIAAVADWAADATMGPNGASNNATYYGDKVHPTATGNGILGPITAVAINSL